MWYVHLFGIVKNEERNDNYFLLNRTNREKWEKFRGINQWLKQKQTNGFFLKKVIVISRYREIVCLPQWKFRRDRKCHYLSCTVWLCYEEVYKYYTYLTTRNVTNIQLILLTRLASREEFYICKRVARLIFLSRHNKAPQKGSITGSNINIVLSWMSQSFPSISSKRKLYS